MAEYAGYVASPPVNLGEITNGLVSNIIAIDQARRQEQLKTQQEFDKYFDENTKQIKEFEFSKNPTFNDKIIPLAEGAKKAIYNAYKSGSKQAVNRVTANLKTSINNINAASKAINENFGVIEKATREGKVSPIGNIYADYYTDAMDFANGEFMVVPDGTIPYTKYSKDGKIESQNSFFDPSVLTKPDAFIDPNIDYDKELNTWAANLGTYTNEKGQVTTTSPTLNPAFPKAKETKIAELISTPRNTARFLSSVAGYQGYKDEESMKKLVAQGVPKEKLIQVSLVDGIPQPILTDKQMADAKKIAEQQINQRIKFTKTLDETRSSSSSMANWLAREEYKDRKKEEQEMRKEAKTMAPKIKAVETADAIFGAKRAYTGGKKPGELGPIPEFSPLKQVASMKGWKNVVIDNQSGDVIVWGLTKNAKKGAKRQELARLSTPGEVYAFLTGKENIIDAKSDYDLTKDYISGMYEQPTTNHPTRGKYD